MYIQFKDDKFLYKQVYNHIREEIIKKNLKYGEKLPSIRQLSSLLNVSKNTVENAYYQLLQEGFIKSVEKSGFYVEKIEDILIMEKKEDSKTIEKTEDKYLYDFSFGGVDRDSFNFKNLKKAFKDSITEDEFFLEHNRGLGYLPLRKAIANYLYSSKALKVSYKQILISTGTNELYLTLFDLFKGKKFAFENPGYAFRGNNKKNQNYIAIDVDQEGINLQSLYKNEVDLVSVTPAHQFPLTTIMSINRRSSLLNWAYQKSNRYIIEDDYDAEFKYKLDPIIPLKALDVNDRVIYMGNFSRVITPALRISYMVLPEEIIRKNKKTLEQMISPASIFVQVALCEYINKAYLEKQINKSKVILAKKHDLILDILKNQNKIHIKSTASGTSFIIKLDKSVDYKKFEEKIRLEKINLPKINDYAYQNKGFNAMYLLGFAKLREKEIKKGLEKIIEIISSI